MSDLLKSFGERIGDESNERTVNTLKRAAKEHEAVRDRLSRVVTELVLIEAAGLLDEELLKQVSASDFGWTRISLFIESADLPKWRAVGKLSAQGKRFERTEHATGKDFIRVTVHVDSLKEFDLEYVRELPAGARCQVVEQPSTYKTLVCSR